MRSTVLGLSGAQLLAGAGAAVTSAFAASRIGVGGTLVGAAVGSVISTIAAAAYAHSLTTAGRRLRRIPTVIRTVPAGSEDAAARVPAVDETLVLPVVEETTTTTSADERRRGGIKALVAGGVAIFLIAMAVITVLELGIGRPVSDSGSDSGGGTSVGRLLGGSQEETPTPSPTTPSPTTTDLPTVTSSPSDSPTPQASPSQTPTSGEPSPTTPAQEISPTPSSPSGDASPTPQP